MVSAFFIFADRAALRGGVVLTHGRIRGPEEMKSEDRQPFKVRSYVKKWYGSDLAQVRAGERPPKSAKLVADLDMGSSPQEPETFGYIYSAPTESVHSGCYRLPRKTQMMEDAYIFG